MTVSKRVVQTTECVSMGWMAMTAVVGRVSQVTTVPQVLTSVKRTLVRTMLPVLTLMGTTHASVQLASLVSHSFVLYILGLSCHLYFNNSFIHIRTKAHHCLWFSGSIIHLTSSHHSPSKLSLCFLYTLFNDTFSSV